MSVSQQLIALRNKAPIVSWGFHAAIILLGTAPCRNGLLTLRRCNYYVTVNVLVDIQK